MYAKFIQTIVFLGVALAWPCWAWAAPPTVTGFLPKQGTVLDQVGIYGTGFNNIRSVKFNGESAGYTRQSANYLTAKVPYGASSGPITVTTAEGTAASADNFTFTIGVAPLTDAGPPTTSVHLWGVGFQPHAAVDVYFDTTHWGLVLARYDGRFSIGFKVPAKAQPGTHWISAVQRNSGLGGQADFTVRTDWPQFHLDGANRYNRYENVLNPANVGDLSLAAIGNVGGIYDIVTSPAVEGSNLWVGTNNGEIYGFYRHIPGETNLYSGCSAYIGGAILGSPAIGNGEVYVVSGNKLHAFDTKCTGLKRIKWYGAIPGAMHSPVTGNSRVFVGSSTESKLYAFKSDCAAGGRECTPVWTGATGASITRSPAVANGVVYAVSEDGKLYAFKVDCGSGGAACTPLWTGDINSYLSSSPTVAGGVVYVGSGDGKLYAFKVGCGSGGSACTPLWTGTIGVPASIPSTPAVAGNEVYIGSESGKLYAFKVGCGRYGASCTPLWIGSVATYNSFNAPAVAGGVVYANAGDYVYAFKAKCGKDGAVCEPLWSGQSNSYSSSPVVVDGVVYMGSNEGNLYAFDLSSSPLSMAKAKTPLDGPVSRPRLEDLKPNPAIKPVPSN
ncbi:MAG: PQQ-binding-like beta-propeller repeat protein [Methylococcus sp.]